MVQKLITGRPRGFDREAELLNIQRVFWTYGYEATALAKLTEATGLHKPSLYAAYGDKKALYLAALDAYLASSTALVGEVLAMPDLRAAMSRFFAVDLDLFLAEQGQGCFLLATAAPVAGIDPDIAKRVSAGLKGLKAALKGRLAAAERSGQLRRGADVEALSDELYSTHIALAIRARAGEKRKSLAATVRRVISNLPLVE